MKKQIFALCLSLVLAAIFSFASLALTSDYITDESGALSENEINSLNEIAEDYYSQYGIAFYYVYVSSDFDDVDISDYVSVNDFIILFENESFWAVVSNGSAKEFIGTNEKNRIWDGYLDGESFYDSITAYFDTCISIITEESSKEEILFPSSNPGRLYDGADILNSSEEQSLLEKLNTVSEEYGTDFIVVTVNTIGSYSADSFTEEFFDRFNYGLGDTRNGVMLLLTMQEREYRILSDGFIGNTLDDYAIETISDAIVSDLSSGNYFNAFNKFISESEYYVNGAINGFPFNYVGSIIISLIIGLVASLIAVNSMKKKLKTVKPVNEANAYMRAGSMNITRSNDMFLYASVTRTAKSNSSSSSRSSSGGGSSRHVGGGRF